MIYPFFRRYNIEAEMKQKSGGYNFNLYIEITKTRYSTKATTMDSLRNKLHCKTATSEKVDYLSSIKRYC
jgi:hypothetical protein